jgi:hypothetical protein
MVDGGEALNFARHDEHRRSRDAGWGRATCALAIALWAFLGWHLPLAHQKFVATAKSYGLALGSPLPRTFVTLPDSTWPIAAGVVGLACVGMQALARTQARAIAWHALALALGALVLLIHHFSVHLPLIKLLDELAKRGAGA